MQDKTELFKKNFLSFINTNYTEDGSILRNYFNINVPEDLINDLKKYKNFVSIIENKEWPPNFYFFCRGIFFNYIDEEGVKKLLEILPPDKLETIYAHCIPKGIRETLLENAKRGDEKGLELLKSLNYDNGYNLSIRAGKNFIKEILNLNILSDDKIKEIESRCFPENELVEIIKNPKKNEELFKKILLLDYFNISEELKNFLKNPIDKNQKEAILNFISNLESKYLDNVLIYVNKEVLKTFIEKSDEEKLSKIHFNKIKEYLKEESGVINFPANINLTDYSDTFSIKEYILKEEDAQKFFSILGFEKIKTFNTADIVEVITNDLFIKALKSNFKNLKAEDELKKELILRTIYLEDIDFDGNKIFSSIDEFITFINENLSKEEINKINLSKIYEDKDVTNIVTKLLEANPPKELPKIDTLIINDELLFKCLKKDNLKAENIIYSDNFTFLSNSDKLKVVKEIIDNNNLFKKLENGEIEYNSEILKKLISNLNKQEVIAFVQFYCKNNEEQIAFDKNKLEEAIKNNKIENNFLKKIHDDYINENPELEGDIKGSYLLNRQENLYLLLLKLDDKLKGRFEKLKKDFNEYIGNEEKQKDIETRKAEIEENRNILVNYIKSLENYRKNDFSESLCSYEEVKEILNFITERYSEEVLRRELLYYQGMIEPFLKRCLKDNKSNLKKETIKKITKEIEESLGVLYYPYSSDENKIEAQKKLKENLNIIGNEYKRVAEEKGEKISGDFLMLSSICTTEENNISDLNDALYATIKYRIAGDYIIKIEDVYAGKNLNTDILYRGFSGIDLDKNKVSTEQMSNPNMQTGRLRFSFWDMTKNSEIINANCNAAGGIRTGPSHVGTFTSYSENLSKSLGVYGRGGILGLYCIPKNLQKSFSSAVGHIKVDEIAGYDIPIEYRIFNIIFNGEPLTKESIDTNEAKDDEKFDVEDVQFSTKMDFVNFKINLNLKDNLTITYTDNNGEEKTKEFEKDRKNQSITKEELKAIIIELEKRGELIQFLSEQLTVERIFDRNKILGEEFYEDLKPKTETEITTTGTHQTNVKKFLKTERRLRKAQKKFKPFNRVISNTNNDNNTKTMYAIPDTHGSYPALIEGLKKSGIIANDKENFIYYKKDDFALENPIYEKPKDYTAEDYIEVPNFKLNNNIKNDVIHLGDLIDKHSNSDTDESLKSIATSILISRQLNGKYTTVIGNHEIANIIDKAYYDGRNQDCKNFILKAIENGEIKLMHHVKGTNIINSHVALIRENILNFLNYTILENVDFFTGFEEKIKKLAKITGFKEKKMENGKIEYIISAEKALLDNNPSEEVLEEFTDIINELFKYIVISEQEKTEKKLTTSLLGSLVNGNRMYVTDVHNTDSSLSYAQGLRTNNRPWTPEELKEHTFDGVTNIIGHDATPNKEEKIGKQLMQGEYLNKAGILFADEWQEDGKAKCVKIEVNEEGKKKYYFYRQEKGRNQFIEGDFVEAGKLLEIFKNKEEKEEFLENIKNCNENIQNNLKNISKYKFEKGDALKLIEQSIDLIKKNIAFKNKLIKNNFSKNQSNEGALNNCILSMSKTLEPNKQIIDLQ